MTEWMESRLKVPARLFRGPGGHGKARAYICRAYLYKRGAWKQTPDARRFAVKKQI